MCLGPWVFRDRIRVRELESECEVVRVIIFWGLDPDRAAGPLLLIGEDGACFKV